MLSVVKFCDDFKARKARCRVYAVAFGSAVDSIFSNISREAYISSLSDSSPYVFFPSINCKGRGTGWIGLAVTGTFGRDSPCCLSDVGLVAESSEAFTDLTEPALLPALPADGLLSESSDPVFDEFTVSTHF